MSSNIVYTSIPQVLGSCKSLQSQLDLMDVILVNMLTVINTATLTGQYFDYTLDTGQTKSSIKFTSLAELQNAYEKMFKTKQMVLAQLNYNKTGRVASLVSAKNFIGNGGWYGW